MESKRRSLQKTQAASNDPNDARSLAIAALRSPTRKEVHAEDYAAVMKVWAKRHRDLGRARNRVACRLHSVLCELVPGGIATEIYAARAATRLDDVEPDGAVAAARHELGLELVDDLRRLGSHLRDSKKRLEAVVAASKTTTTEIFGVGPVIAAMVVGYTGDVGRFSSRDRFAADNGTAPIEVSSGNRKTYRLSLRGNRQLNHAIHMAAVTQIRHRHSDGRAYYDRKVATGKTGKEALRALKRRISDNLYRHLQQDAERAVRSTNTGPGGQSGNDSDASATGSHPATPALRPSHSRTRTHATPARPATGRNHRPPTSKTA